MPWSICKIELSFLIQTVAAFAFLPSVENSFHDLRISEQKTNISIKHIFENIVWQLIILGIFINSLL